MRLSFGEEKKRFCGKELAKPSIINKRQMPDTFDNRPALAWRELPAHAVTDSALQSAGRSNAATSTFHLQPVTSGDRKHWIKTYLLYFPDPASVPAETIANTGTAHSVTEAALDTSSLGLHPEPNHGGQPVAGFINHLSCSQQPQIESSVQKTEKLTSGDIRRRRKNGGKMSESV